MSTNFSVWLGRSDGIKRQSVRRCLFGMPDRANVNEALKIQEEIQEREDSDAKRFRERWDFDLVNGCPIEGKAFVWTSVDVHKERIPEFYTKGYAPRKSKPVSRIRESWRGPYNQSVFADTDTQVHSRRSVKRRLNMDLDDDQENKHVPSIFTPNSPSLRLPSPHSEREEIENNPVATSPSSLTVPSNSLSSSSSNTDSSDGDCVVNGGVSDRGSLSSTSRKRSRVDVELIPSSDYITPQRQTLINDFYPVQKMRRSTKSLFEI